MRCPSCSIQTLDTQPLLRTLRRLDGRHDFDGTQGLPFAAKNWRPEMKRITFIAFISAIALGAATPDHVTSVENGLLPAGLLQGPPVPPYRIADPMKGAKAR